MRPPGVAKEMKFNFLHFLRYKKEHLDVYLLVITSKEEDTLIILYGLQYDGNK